MALDFNLLRPAGGLNPVNAFFQGQQASLDRETAQQNAMLAQQKAAQDQEVNALRRQQLTGQIQTQEETRVKNKAAEKTGLFRDRLLRARTPEDARNLVRMQYADPDLAPILSQAASVEQALAEISDNPIEFEKYRQQEALGMSEWMKSQMPKVVGNRVFSPATMSYIEPPERPQAVAQPPMVAEFNFARSPEGGSFTGSYQDFVIAREAAKRPPPAPRVSGGGGNGAGMPKAPPGYRYTLTGDLEAIPGGPAATKQNEARGTRETGRAQATDILDSLGDAYTELDRMKAIPSQQRNAVSNLLSSIAASPVGQVAGRAAGTEAQTQRDIASSARLQLFAAVKNATGMSSQQLNSNVEFTTWLNSLTDPARGIETNKTILENMRKFIDSGGTYTAKKGDGEKPASGSSNVTQERANANAAIAAGAPAAAVRQRFKQNTGQEL
jgi:hypothetical protein